MASSRRSGRPDAGARAGLGEAAGEPAGEVADPDGRAAVDAAVEEALRRLPHRAKLLLAFSGGRDSTVLLDALVRFHGPALVVAWHVHHGLQPAADRWLAFCEREAARHGVRFGCTRLAGGPGPGDNVEAWARDARYGALWQAVADAGAAALLTAHHADDQLETVFMRLARGSGPEALGGMAPAEHRAGGWLLRPLLGVGRDRIDGCARARRLEWVDDPMNTDETFLRVTLRARVLPALAAAVPGLRDNVLRTAALLRETGETLRAIADADLHDAGLTPDLRSIDRCTLSGLPALRRSEATRAWFRMLGLQMPTQARLAQWVGQMLLGGSAAAAFTAPPLRFRRYRDRITVEPVDARDWRRHPPPALTLQWRGEAALALPGWNGRLCVRPSTDAAAVDARWLAGQSLEVRPPPAAARLRPRRDGPSRTLKNLYQEHGVPPWLRAAMPAVFVGERLLYAAGLGMDASGEHSEGAERVHLYWRPDDPDDPRSTVFESAAAV